MSIETQKETARLWFKNLRDIICAEFETLEAEADPNLYPGAPGEFVFEDWQRKQENGGGGTGERWYELSLPAAGCALPARLLYGMCCVEHDRRAKAFHNRQSAEICHERIVTKTRPALTRHDIGVPGF